MKKPFFSVIIPTLNEERFLPNLLVSLQAQAYKNFEVILVDGKSKDKTVHVAKSFVHVLPSLTVVVPDHASLPFQRNTGADAATGEWLVFVDADTVLFPFTLERIFQYIQAHDVRVLTTWFSPDSDEGKDARFVLLSNLAFETAKMMKRTTAPGPFTVVKHGVFNTIGKYDEEHSFLEDQDFSQRTAKLGIDIHIIRETLYIWSLRRYRKEGTFKVIQEYMKVLLPVLFLKTTPKNLSGYTMGGHIFSKKKTTVKSSLLSKTEKQIRDLMQELFE